MWVRVVGSIGFLCYFIYDINSVTIKNHVLQKFFLLGTLLAAVSTAGILMKGWDGMCASWIRTLCFGIFALFMFGLLVYTLFFALPFDATYVEESRERRAYTEGVYALCRHPGVLWFALMYLGIAGMIWNGEALLDGGLLIAWNTAYICLQDWRIFPKTFTNYEDYRQMTPFLIPNGRSVRRCRETWGRGEITR